MKSLSYNSDMNAHYPPTSHTVKFTIRPIVEDAQFDIYQFGDDTFCDFEVLASSIDEAIGKALLVHILSTIGKTSMIVAVNDYHINN